MSWVKQLEGWGGSPLPSEGFGVKPDPSALSVASLAWPGGCGDSSAFHPGDDCAAASLPVLSSMFGEDSAQDGIQYCYLLKADILRNIDLHS